MSPNLSRYGSPYNWQAPNFQQRPLPEQITIHDLTLEGDGEEMAGVQIIQADKIELAKRLSELGVPRLSVLGYSPMPPLEEIHTAEKIVALDLPVKLGSFVKTAAEIELAAKIGLWGVTILVMTNEAALPLGKTGADVAAKGQALTQLAKSLGLHTCLMTMDATRARPEFLKQVIQGVEPFCDEICIADSLGVVSPYGFQYLIEQVRQWTAHPLQVHCHNHSSMAVANGLAAVLGGATILHTTVNGLGEFAGLLALEELAVALAMHLQVDTGLDLSQLKALSTFVSQITGVPVPLQKPAVGSSAFCIPETEEIQEALYALVEKGNLKDCLTYPPELVGNHLSMSIGRRCNEYTVRYNLEAKGWTASSETIDEIVAAVRTKATQETGYYLMDEETFFQFVTEKGYPLDLV
jgi:isopropylmalate/homocitrate/citramalate synthase